MTNTPQLLAFQALPQTAPLTPQLAEAMADLFKSSLWVDTFNCITALRSINKFNSELSPQVVQHFLIPLGQELHHGVTLVVKNSLLLMKEIFMMGVQIDVRNSIVFFPYVLKKSVLSTGKVKEMAKQALHMFTLFCSYEECFKVIAESCFNNNPEISEMAVKVFFEFIKSTGANILQLQPDTMKVITICLNSLLGSGRQNLKSLAHEISMSIFSCIGAQDFVKLLTFTLGQHQAQAMMGTMNKRHSEMISSKNIKEMRQSKLLNGGNLSKNKQNNCSTNSPQFEFY